ncbi:MAG TPA: sulfite exporter TauE/SafE family protein [Candidatus Omnitrophota bacterium]|nr:sulfite exporter TauE/SafE family protein [Candidatus Omnitrophota bacterium]HRY85636.1 sulfite exporter TauE/SafE family protein [Candidatus Omnitrophota bacterium]
MAIALIGVLGGFLGGLFGVGGGTVFVPLLVFLKGFDIHRAIGTSLLIIIFTAIAGAIFHGRAGMVDWKAAVVLGIFSMLGVWLGTKLSLKLETVMLQRAFAVFLILMAIKLFFDKQA